MADGNQRVVSDDELLVLARSVLAQQGYAVEEIVGDVGILLAENAYFLVGVVATSTIAQLLVAEGIAEAVISERLAASDAGPKRWDAYLILLTQERLPESETTTRELFEINYDTARLRRIAHAGVSPTIRSVSEALSPFLKPVELADASVIEDPFKLLVRALTSRGVDPALAGRAVTAFEKGVPLGDVL